MPALALLAVLALGACGTSRADTPVRTADGGVTHTPQSVVSSAVGLAEATVPAAAEAGPGSSTSLGSPNDGRIEGAVAVPSVGIGFKLNERRINVDSFFGTMEMVGMIERAASATERDVPGSTLIINDVSFRQGGPIPHHGSHQSGRDADLLFYLTDRRGRPVQSRGVVIEPDGTGFDYKDLAEPSDDEPVRIDVRRTWRLVRAMVEDDARVQRLFIAEHIRTMLLAEAERVRAPRRVRERAGDVMCQPGTPHDDHIHVRLFCTGEDMRVGCLDGNPMYPWRRGELRAEGILTPSMATGRRRHAERPDREPSSVAVPGPRPHRLVRELLDRRRGWSRTPHPGRPWCS